jgi:hypothetical protein
MTCNGYKVKAGQLYPQGKMAVCMTEVQPVSRATGNYHFQSRRSPTAGFSC